MIAWLLFVRLSLSVAAMAWLISGMDSGAQTFTTLHDFSLDANPFGTNNDGANPMAGLLIVRGGGLLPDTFYGTAAYGGTNANGTIFKVRSNGTAFGVVYPFSAGSYDTNGNLVNTDGAQPGRLILQATFTGAETLYGVAEYGGTNGYGTVFKVSTNGTGFTVLHTFSPDDEFNTDGIYPNSLVLAGNTLYGTAAGGGLNGSGTIFKVNTDGTGFTVLYPFEALQYNQFYGFYYNGSGALPNSLILSGNMLYGTADEGGYNTVGSTYTGSGTIFAITTNATVFTVLHYFSLGSSGTNTDGVGPNSLYLSGTVLYGTASSGGTANSGTVFSLDTNGTNFSILYSFSSRGNYPYTNSDGYAPQTVIRSGHMAYGTTSGGGIWDHGTVFQIQTNGTGFVNFYNFTPSDIEHHIVGGTDFEAYTNSDGIDPQGNLVVSGNTLYGTAYQGGTSGSGTIFGLTMPPTSPIPLNIQLSGSDVILTWTNAVFSLQGAPALTGVFATIPGATSPYTNTIGASQEFFRLSAP